MFNFDWNVIHQKRTFLKPSGLNILGMFRFDIILTSNWDISYFYENWTVAKCFHCTDNFQCSEKDQNPNDSFSIQLWTFYEHSHLNIHTIFILNYEGIIFECSPKHSRNVPWMLPCTLGRDRLMIIAEQALWAQILPECYMNVQFWSEYSGPIMNISAMFRS